MGGTHLKINFMP